MSETRRQLFKTSVLSAFGLMSAPALVACNAASSEGLKPLYPTGDPTLPIFAPSDDGAFWYIFAVDMTDSQRRFQVWQVDASVIAMPVPFAVDAAWQMTVGKRTQFMGSSLTIGGATYTLDSTHHVTVISPSSNPFVNALKWNEIGGAPPPPPPPPPTK